MRIDTIGNRLKHLIARYSPGKRLTYGELEAIGFLTSLKYFQKIIRMRIDYIYTPTYIYLIPKPTWCNDMSYTKGYKAFNRVEGNKKQGECRGFLFSEGETYSLDGKFKLCANGFHFCKDLVLTFEYYGSDLSKFVFAEVEAVGEVVYEEPTKHKCATSKIKITRFLNKKEILSILDRKENSGICNSGNWNSGNSNSGHSNSGNSNSGHSNSGNSNSGNSNSGNSNSGIWNWGNWNSGNWNSGNWNSGNWNSCNNETGFFNSKQTTVNVFNAPCDVNIWDRCKKPDFIFFNEIKGSYKNTWQDSFSQADKRQCELLINLPNFDYSVFEEITSITKEQIESVLAGEE